MASMSAQSSRSRKLHGKHTVGDVPSLTRKINKMKKQIEAERVAFVKEKVTENKWRVESCNYQLLSLVTTRTEASSMHNNMLSSRIENPLHLIPGKAPDDLDNRPPEAVIYVTSKLPVVEKIPCHTTWIFLKRNWRMSEDDSMKGKLPIPYDQIGGKARTYNDEDQIAEASEEKHEFSMAEKRIIRMVCQDSEPSEEVLQILTQHIGGAASEIHEVYNMLKKEDEDQNVSVPAKVEHDMSMLLEKSLVNSLDSFDALFCRRCLVFDCSLHGYAEPVITPAKQLKYPLESQEDRQPCSGQCYRESHTAMKYPERGGSSNIDNTRTSGKCADPGSSICRWKPLEVDLYMKGRQIFGSNSCLITRNLLDGLKTCLQVHNYMHDAGSDMHQIASSSCSISDDLDHKGQERPSTSQRAHQKGKEKKRKHSSKSAGSPSTWRRIADGKDELEKQYTPCQCKSMCRKECPCLKKLTYCEKYCGCSNSCKNRFRGCHCTKTQCRSQRCPCFAAGRECDPDICRNCWVRCGDGSSGESSRRGEGECSNMRLLLGQHQRILLGKSDVVGWGAFLKNSVNKDDYLGEYTGEVISHEEAATRGTYYDKKGSSFLFNLNDENVLDALRKGNKLKFANHSPNPNCYAKIVKVGGDHRVGIFAKEPIEAGQELFYDYCYKPDAAPIWAHKPDDDDSSAPRGQAKKHRPHQ